NVDNDIFASEPRGGFACLLSVNDHLAISVCQIELSFGFGDTVGPQWLAFGKRNSTHNSSALFLLCSRASRYTVDDDPVDENFFTFIRDRIDKSNLFLFALLRQIDHREFQACVWVTLPSIE